MKKLLTSLLVIIATLSLAVCAAACSKDDGKNEDNGNTTADVAGTYYYASVTKIDTNGNTLMNQSYTEQNSPTTYTLNDDGTLIVTITENVTEILSGTWSATGNNVSITVDDYTATGTVEGNTLKVIIPNTFIDNGSITECEETSILIKIN